MPLNIIDATPYLGKDKVPEVCGHLLDRFRKAIVARTNQIDGHYKRWMDNYSAKPNESVRTTPWYRASNFVPQLIRMHVDILTARMVGIIFGTKPFWKPSSVLDSVPREILQVLGSWLEFETSGQRMNYYPAIRSGIYRGFKTGTNIYKTVWKDAGTYGFNVVMGLGQGAAGIQTKQISKEGMELEPLPFEDFFPFPITVASLDKVSIKFHRLRFTKEDIEFRRDKGIWNKSQAQYMIDNNGDYKASPARESQAQEAGITLTKDVVMPFTAVEAWFDYPLGIGGDRYKLVATFNPYVDKPEDGLLRFYFNPDARGEDPFVLQSPMPREDFIFGYAIPELLEQAQEEQAQIHNHRRDANTIANNPGWIKKRMADVPNPASDWYPGKVFEVDAMDDVAPIQFSGNYNSMIEEESFLLNLTDKYTGMGSPMQAMGSGILDGKRGVYSSQGTMAMLQAGSDRPDMYLKEYREAFHKIGRKIYRSNRDWRTKPLPYEFWGANGQLLKFCFEYPEPDDYDPVHFSIGASDGSSNKEADRTNLLLMANTAAGYYNQIFQAVSVVGQLPPDDPRRELLLMVIDSAKDLFDRLLFVFDIGDRNKLIPDVRSVLGGGSNPSIGGNAGAPEAGVPPSEESVPLAGIQALSQSIGALPR